MGCIYSKIRRQYYCCCCNPHHPSQPPSPTPPPPQQPQPHLLLSSPTPTSTISLPSSLSLTFSSLSQPGLYPESSPGRLNQDSLSILSLSPSLHLFSVFDGHGLFGSQCATFTSKTLSLSLASHLPSLPLTPALSFSHAFHTTNSLLHSHPDIDDSMSGTTAIAVLVHNHNLIIANVGDSRAVAGVWDPNLASIVAMDLSSDQTPFRKDEYERVRACGARVLSVDQLEGLKDPEVQSWGEESDDDGDPPRLWVKDGMYPGTAFTRSVGDATAERIGVVAEPEVKEVGITEDMRFFVVASDGVFEFMSSQAVVDMVASFKDPRDACAAVVAESYKLWLEHENRTDDITIIVVHIKDMNNDPVSIDGVSQINSKPSVVTSQKARGERNTFQCAGTRTHLRRDSVSELQTCCDFSMELGPACVAPSPEHSYKM